jgi:MOSC domain-containing protein
MHVAELWRYPVKSLKGDRLEEIEICADGLAGDRLVHVRGANGRVITSRTRPRLLALQGTIDRDGTSLIDGRPWHAEESRAAVRMAAGADAELVAYAGPERFDVLPLSIATDGAVAAVGVDRRRFRPNILVAGVDGLAERTWPGRQLRIGDAVIAVARLRPRCVMTTYDPDTQDQDHSVLRRIVQEFGGALALDCAVVEPGVVRVGDQVEFMRSHRVPIDGSTR